MADSLEGLSSGTSGQAGGAATSAGITFQQQVGALFGACLLSEERVDGRLNLGTAVPVWIRFETEAPVDDILVCTSNDGYIAVQAKTKVSLSRDLTSPFGKTVSQFVRHWIACRGGDESRGWNRPLDPARDRLVLAVRGMFGIRVKTGHRNASCCYSLTRLTISPTTDRLTLPFTAS